MRMDSTKHRRLLELDRSDFEIVKGEPDIRGWDVRNAHGQKIGEVEELIVDAEKRKVRYMVVDLDDNELKLDHRKVLLPIGLAELHQKNDDVILPAVNAEHLRALPAYDRGDITSETEQQICSTLGRKTEKIVLTKAKKGAKESGPNPDFYRHDYYNDDNLYRHRLHETQQPAEKQQESEYERGLRLWELRSEGGILPDKQRERQEANDETRMELVRSRRKAYEDQRRASADRQNDGTDDRPRRKHNSIIARTRDEGLQDG